MTAWQPSLFLTMRRVSRMLRKHDWRGAVTALVEDENVTRQAALAFVRWERESTITAGTKPSR